MAITTNDAKDIYGNPLQRRFSTPMTQKDFSAAAERMYGNAGPGGMTLSVAETYVGQLFDATRAAAQVNGHLADIPVIEGEARALANFAHANLTQPELQELARRMGPHMKPLTDVGGDEQSLAKAEYAGNQALTKKFGLVGGGQVHAAAQAAIGRLANAGLRRVLIDHGAQHDEDVIQYMANLAYQKGWAKKPQPQTLSFEPPRAA